VTIDSWISKSAYEIFRKQVAPEFKELVMHSFSEFERRYHHILTEFIGDLYAAELQLKELRYKVGL